MIAAHVIFGTYGFWLPNDPRGSWSTFVGSYELYQYGPATKTDERRSVAHREHDRGLRLTAKTALKRPAVRLTEAQRSAVAEGFGEYVRKSGLLVWACAVMPDHVHFVVAASPMPIKQRVIQLKGAAVRSLEVQGLHPFEERIDGVRPKCFAQGEWKVFLDEPLEVERAVVYVEGNPDKEGLPRQRWPFVSDWRLEIANVVPVREDVFR